MFLAISETERDVGSHHFPSDVKVVMHKWIESHEQIYSSVDRNFLHGQNEKMDWTL